MNDNTIIEFDKDSYKDVNPQVFNLLMLTHLVPLILENYDELKGTEVFETQIKKGNVKKYGNPFYHSLEKTLTPILRGLYDMDSDAYDSQNKSIYYFLKTAFSLNPSDMFKFTEIVSAIKDGKIKSITIEKND